MKKHEFLYKSLIVISATVFLIISANLAFAAVDTVVPNFTGLEVGDPATPAGEGDISVSGNIMGESNIAVSGHILAAGTLDAADGIFTAGPIGSSGEWIATSGTVWGSTGLGTWGDIYSLGGGTITAGSLDISGSADIGSINSLNVTGGAEIGSTLHVGDEITLNPLYGSVHADEIGSFYVESDYCNSTVCSGLSYYNKLEVFCHSGDIVISCEAYAFDGSTRSDMVFGAPPYDNYPSVVTWSPGFDSCVGWVNNSDAGVYVQALCFDPEGLTGGGYSDGLQPYSFR